MVQRYVLPAARVKFGIGLLDFSFVNLMKSVWYGQITVYGVAADSI